MAETSGTEYNEVLYGTDEDDIITGFSGYDTLDGGEGSDTYIVNAGDFQTRYVDFYQDSGTSGTDVILAAEAGIIIGIGDGFSYASSGIERIDGIEGSTISGDNDRQVWDFTGVEITGVNLLFGMGGHDEIRGSNAADTIDGGTGHDALFGGLGADEIFGGEGHDTLHGDDGNDSLNGGLGHDQLFGGDGRDTLTGGDWNDMLYGGDGSDFLNGNAGYDYLDGGNGSDVYYVGLDNAGFVDEYKDTGESGRDVIRAIEAGTVIGLMSGFGSDSGIEAISSARNADVTIGGTNDAEVWDFSATTLHGIQWINALDGHDDVTGSARRDRIDGGDGNDMIDGGAGNDYIKGGNGFDHILGGEGKDRLEGGAGNDSMDGGQGRDLYLFNTDSNGGFDDIMDSGTEGRDVIRAMEEGTEIGLGQSFGTANGIEVISSGKNANVTIEGDDAGNNWDFSDVRLYRIEAINSGDGMDVVQGNNQHNVINGEAGHDQLYGGKGRDTLSGGADSDFLFGEQGHDILFGDDGNDVLTGGLGRDMLTGGDGYDTFVFGEKSGRDTITDFEDGYDIIEFRDLVDDFTDLTITQNGADTVIKSANGVITLTDFDSSLLDANDFSFA